MKNINFLSKVTVPLLFCALLFSCQQDEVTDSSSGVEFILSPAMVQNGGKMKQDEFPTVGEGMCDLINAAYAEVSIQGLPDAVKLPIKQWGSDYKTNLVELAPGNYTILSFVVFNDQDEAIFATPLADSQFGPFVSEPLPINFTVSLYEKSQQNIEILCVENFTPPQFGFAFWNIDLKSTKQLCIFGNYCEAEFGHRVAEMEAWVYPNDQQTTAADLIWRTKSDPEDENPENNLLCLKFPYDPEIPAEDQSYYVILRLEDIFLTATLSLDDIDQINEEEGYLHLNNNCREDYEPFRISDEHRVTQMENIDLSIHYQVIGNGSIQMVFVPGWTNPLTVYSKQIDYFRDKARSIYIDLPAQGLSDAPPPGNPLDPEAPGLQFTMELMAEAVYTVVKEEGLEDFIAVGFSSGPRVWGIFEKTHPGMISKLVNLDGGFFPWPEDPAEREKRQQVREATYLAQLEWDINAKKALAKNLVPPGTPEDLQEWVNYFWYYPSDLLANSLYYIDAENVNEPVGWTYPKLCFYAMSNPNMDKVNWIYPNNTTYTFPGGGHVIQWVFHEEINPIIWDFVKE